MSDPWDDVAQGGQPGLSRLQGYLNVIAAADDHLSMTAAEHAALPDRPAPVPAPPGRPRVVRLEQPADLEWMDRAACRGMPPDWWFPEKHMSSTPEAVRAKRVCGGCPVRVACLEFGLYDQVGIWGGEGESSRRELRRGRPRVNRVRHGTRACYRAGCRRPECVDANTEYQRRKRAS